MKQGTLKIVQDLQANGEDHEWYPTKASDVKIITDDIKKIKEDFDFTERYSETVKFLDVGAGCGKVLNLVEEAFSDYEGIRIDPYAIEKASVHTSTYRKKGITLLGTEFNQVNFISKHCHIGFVNPPYSEFEYWISTLISHLQFGVLYAVIPKRWQESETIRVAMESRGVKFAKVLAESDFLDADRAARAKVHVIRFSFNELDIENLDSEKAERLGRRHYKPSVNHDYTDPFQQFIEEQLGLKKTYSETTNKFSEYQEKERIRKAMATEGTPSYELVQSRGILWALLDNYEADLERTLKQYKVISTLDPTLLQELGVDYDALRKGAKEKLLGYRNVFWGLLFEKLEAISERLTSKHRKSLLNSLSANNLDFTYTNAIYIVGYAVELGNELIETSLIDVFKMMTSPKSISRYYRSNEHVFSDDWRYNRHYEKDNKAKYLLDYRFIHTSYGNFDTSWGDHRGLNENARGYVNDLKVALKLLGYSNLYTTCAYEYMNYGDTLSIIGTDPDGEVIELVKIRFYKNGNKHNMWDQNAMLRLNCTASRLLGWVRSKEEFVEDSEITEVVEDDVWELSDEMKVKSSNVLLLTQVAA